jgi:flagellar motility protein MotE (MotC chaperone)
LVSTCTATKRDGSPCTLPSYGSDGLCWAHDPKNAERRRRGQSRGGKSKPSKELASIKQRLSDLADDVLTGAVDKGVAAVASQILNVYLRAIELERKIRETEELEERLAALEKGATERGSRWQA